MRLRKHTAGDFMFYTVEHQGRTSQMVYKATLISERGWRGLVAADLHMLRDDLRGYAAPRLTAP